MKNGDDFTLKINNLKRQVINKKARFINVISIIVKFKQLLSKIFFFFEAKRMGAPAIPFPAVRSIFYSAKAPQKDAAAIRAKEISFLLFGMILKSFQLSQKPDYNQFS